MNLNLKFCYCFHLFPFLCLFLQDDLSLQSLKGNCERIPQETTDVTAALPTETGLTGVNKMPNNLGSHVNDEESIEVTEPFEACNSNEFLRRFFFHPFDWKLGNQLDSDDCINLQIRYIHL